MYERIPFLLLFYPVFLFSLSFHESAHAWMANRFGDPTAKMLGRVTLNPLPHMDPVGTFILPVMAILFPGMPMIGWGKPVPVNPYNLKDPRRDDLFIAGLGPASNLLLALVFAFIGRLEVFVLDSIGDLQITGPAATLVAGVFTICRIGVNLNLALAIFNLLPVYPLDGGGVIRGLLPEKAVAAYDRFGRQGMFLLLILFASGLLKYIFIPVQIVANILLPVNI